MKNCSLTSVTKVWCGGYSSFVKDDQDSVWVFGSSDCGELGLGDRTPRSTPTRQSSMNGMEVIAGGYHIIGVAHDGSIYGVGYNKLGQLGLSDSETRFYFTKIPDVTLFTKISRVKSANFTKAELMESDL
jgi:alpha-tubulin suppressor-like RCC1 family protein